LGGGFISGRATYSDDALRHAGLPPSRPNITFRRTSLAAGFNQASSMDGYHYRRVGCIAHKILSRRRGHRCGASQRVPTILRGAQRVGRTSDARASHAWARRANEHSVRDLQRLAYACGVSGAASRQRSGVLPEPARFFSHAIYRIRFTYIDAWPQGQLRPPFTYLSPSMQLAPQRLTCASTRRHGLTLHGPWRSLDAADGTGCAGRRAGTSRAWTAGLPASHPKPMPARPPTSAPLTPCARTSTYHARLRSGLPPCVRRLRMPRITRLRYPAGPALRRLTYWDIPPSQTRITSIHVTFGVM